MKGLVIKNNEMRITSVELVGIINQFRELENRKELLHKSLMKKIRTELETLNMLGLNGEQNFLLSYYINLQNKEQPCYDVNRDGMLQILNSESVLVRFKTIEYINKLEQQLKEINTPSYMIENPIERAKAWIKEQEEREQQARQLEEQKPLVEFANSIACSSDCIEVGSLAKVLCDEGIKIGRNKLFKWLREHKYLMDNNQPYQRYIDNGYFEMKEYVIKTAYGDKNCFKTLVTGIGQIRITEKLKELGI